jgi:hypothetical protein
LLGEYGDQQISVIIYGINIIIIGAWSNLEWWYATKNHRLVESDLDPTFIKIMARRYFLARVFLFNSSRRFFCKYSGEYYTVYTYSSFLSSAGT